MGKRATEARAPGRRQGRSVAPHFGNAVRGFKKKHGTAGLTANAVGARQCVQRPALVVLGFQTRGLVFAIGKERAHQVNDQLIRAELVVERVQKAVTEEHARLVKFPGADSVVVELDQRGQVFHARHLVRVRKSGEIIAQAVVGGSAIGHRQPVVGIVAHDGVQVEPAHLGLMIQQPTCREVPQVGIKIPFGGSEARRGRCLLLFLALLRLSRLLSYRERLEGFVFHGAAEAGDATQQCLPVRREAVVGRLQNVMLPLHQIAAHVQPRCGSDVAGLLKIAHNQAGQQSQAERMVAVRCAGRFNLGARTTDALRTEEFHRVGRMHLLELLLAAPLQQSSAFGFQHVRTKPGR